MQDSPQCHLMGSTFHYVKAKQVCSRLCSKRLSMLGVQCSSKIASQLAEKYGEEFIVMLKAPWPPVLRFLYGIKRLILLFNNGGKFQKMHIVSIKTFSQPLSNLSVRKAHYYFFLTREYEFIKLYKNASAFLVIL